ncbi:1-acyl-sn-glycerol-3-phosphate acyltransferase, partial [Streptococcus pneumoniae]
MIRYNNNKKTIEGDRMFYTYLRGLVVLLLW